MSDYFRGIITIKELKSEPGATSLIGDFRDHTDPKYIGPGTWNLIHRKAYKVRTHSEQLAFIELMKETCYGFPCTICKGHCTEYIKNHPLEEYLDVVADINGEKVALGMFIWTWKFHNAVNTRVKKPLMSWETAYNLYSQSDSLVCSKNCLATADDGPADGAEQLPPDPHESKWSQNTVKRSGDGVPNVPEPRVRPAPETKAAPPFRLVSGRRR